MLPQPSLQDSRKSDPLLQLTRPEAVRVSGMRPWHVAVLGIAVVTLFRLWYATRLDLVPDEAYYWVWSRHLAASYRDKGPAIAWAIALGAHLCGDTAFGIRFLGVLFSAGTAFQVYRLAERFYGGHTALWCLLVTMAMPIISVGSILMTIDTLSVFFWAWAANLFWTGVETERMRYWLMLGFAIGVGFLSKFTNGVQLVCFALFLCWSRPHRHFLFSRQSLATLLVFGICALPILWWNIQTGWVHFQALQSRSGVEHSFGVHPREILRFVAEQFLVISPLIMIGMVIGVAVVWSKHSDDARIKYLLSQFVPVQGLFLFFSLNKAGKSNWIAPSLITGVILLVVFWRPLLMRRRAWRWAVLPALGVSIFITAFLHAVPMLHVPRRLDPFRRAEGWSDFAAHVQAARERHQPALLIANHYSQASLMQFYLHDHPVTYLPPAAYGSSQFTLWPAYSVKPGIRALYVADEDAPPPENLQAQFTRWQLVDDFWSDHHGRQTTHFRIYLLEKS